MHLPACSLSSPLLNTLRWEPLLKGIVAFRFPRVKRDAGGNSLLGEMSLTEKAYLMSHFKLS